MGFITPVKKDNNLKSMNKHFLDDALKQMMMSTEKDEDGNVKSIAERMAYSLIQDALYAETVKDRTTCKKLIYERVGGKPAVIEDEEKEDLPEVVFRVSANDAKKLEALKGMDNLDVEHNEDKVIVDIDGEPKMEF